MKKSGLNLPKEKSFVGPATAFKRVMAFLIDLFIIYFIIGFPLNNLLKKLMPPAESFTDNFKYLFYTDSSAAILFAIFSLELICILYFVILEHKLGQSIGKIVMKIHVVSEQKELKLWQLIVRSLFLIADIIWVVDIIYYLFNKQRRLFEVLSKTRTVEHFDMDRING